MRFPSKIARDCPYMESPSVKSHIFTDEVVKMTVLSVKWKVFTDDLKKLVLIVHPAMQSSCKTQKKNRKSLKIKDLRLMYPEPGSNRHGLLHWCLRPARLPIPPSGRSALLCAVPVGDCCSVRCGDDFAIGGQSLHIVQN